MQNKLKELGLLLYKLETNLAIYHRHTKPKRGFKLAASSAMESMQADLLALKAMRHEIAGGKPQSGFEFYESECPLCKDYVHINDCSGCGRSCSCYKNSTTKRKTNRKK